jgi:hypothetical protein
MKVKFVKFPIALRLSYNVGDVADIRAKASRVLIAEGYAEEVKVEKKKKPINPEEGD